MGRPLHFFGGFGAMGILTGSSMALALLVMKIANPHADVMDKHGPLFVIASVLILAGVQLLAFGLLGELQVRHHFTNEHPASYAVERLVRLAPAEEQGLIPGPRDTDF
jgi:hypothetical protein